MAAKQKKNAGTTAKAGRNRVSQLDVPYYSLGQAIRIPQVIADEYAGRKVRPLQIAQALNVQPTTGPFRMLCGSAIAWGLTDGGYNAEQVELTPLGRRIVLPTKEGDDAAAMREAVLKPRIPRDFLQQYDGSKIPREDIARNVLADMGVPREQTKRVLNLIVECARTVGFVREIGGVPYVDLEGVSAIVTSETSWEQPPSNSEELGESDEVESEEVSTDVPADGSITPTFQPPKLTLPSKSPRVFISHGKNMEIVQQVKTMLNVSEIEYEVAVEEESLAIPVPEKVIGAMRNCTAAIICVTRDDAIQAASPLINQNVLIEIGIAFVLYEKRVILLWEKGLPIPSNLQGLYRCEFEGKDISWATGMRLMEAIKGLKH